MAVIEVRAPGLSTTVQDLGRPGFGPLGVSACGAADPVALVVGNRMLGNPPGAAALEMTLSGGEFVFPEGGVVVLAGADFTTPAVWSPIELPPGGALRAGVTRSGARCYLCVRGGIAVPHFLGSASTHLLSGMGGLDGRTLRAGDILPVGPAPSEPVRRVRRAALERLAPRKALRATAGPQIGEFPPDALTTLAGAAYRVTEEANRMGIRLEGPALPTPHGGHMITEGVPLGGVQVPAGGQPIVLFVEQQTTGGYPILASVISADLPSLGQLRPRDEVRFEMVSYEDARRSLAAQWRLLMTEDLFR